MKPLHRVLLLCVAAVAAIAPAGGQTSPQETAASRELFPSPMASPTEPASLFRFVGDGQFDFGLTQPFTIFSDEGKGTNWQLGLRPGIVTRFQTRDTQLLLKAADFRLGIPVAFRRGNWSARVELFHVSSHRGADFDATNPAARFSYSREVIQTLLAYGRPDRWRVYAGPSVTLHTRPSNLGRMSFQAGSEWFPKPLAFSRGRFYLADDFETRQEVGWQMNYSVQPGTLFTTAQGEPIARLVGWFYRGQAPFGQFFRERETIGGVQFVLELRPTIHSLVTRRR
ncbi:MAG: DUF1207 domain-containing protein [Terriglobia bacterium]